MSNTVKKFKAAFENYKRSIKETMAYAQDASYLALVHFSECGDVTFLKNFYDATPKNFGRKEAFSKWCMAYSPLQIVETEKGETVWQKGKDENGNDIRPFNLAAAAKEPFWEFAPDNTGIDFDVDNILEALEKTIKRFGNKNYHAKSVNAVATLAYVGKQVQALKGQVNEMVKNGDILEVVEGGTETDEEENTVIGTLSTSSDETGEKVKAA